MWELIVATLLCLNAFIADNPTYWVAAAGFNVAYQIKRVADQLEKKGKKNNE